MLRLFSHQKLHDRNKSLVAIKLFTSLTHQTYYWIQLHLYLLGCGELSALFPACLGCSGLIYLSLTFDEENAALYVTQNCKGVRYWLLLGLPYKGNFLQGLNCWQQ